MTALCLAAAVSGMEAKCRISQHSTAYIAGAFAHCIQAKHLVLTHFSGRYTPTGPPSVRRLAAAALPW